MRDFSCWLDALYDLEPPEVLSPTAHEGRSRCPLSRPVTPKKKRALRTVSTNEAD